MEKIHPAKASPVSKVIRRSGAGQKHEAVGAVDTTEDSIDSEKQLHESFEGPYVRDKNWLGEHISFLPLTPASAFDIEDCYSYINKLL
jgi:hypothetical protein